MLVGNQPSKGGVGLSIVGRSMYGAELFGTFGEIKKFKPPSRTGSLLLSTPAKTYHAITDSGATDHFLMHGALVDDVEVAEPSIEIRVPNGTVEKTPMCVTSEFQGYKKN